MRRGLGDVPAVLEGGGKGLVLDLEVQPCGEFACPQHADRILAVAQVGIADHADATAIEILKASHIVDNGAVGGSVEQGIDGEVAAEGVLSGCAVGVVAGYQEFAG